MEEVGLSLYSAWAVLRRYVVLIVIATLAGGLVATGHVVTTDRVYTATATTLLTAVPTDDTGTLSQSVQFLKQRMSSYPSVATSQDVLGPVISDLSLDMDIATVRGDVAVTVPEDTTVVAITASASTPSLAADIANGVSSRFSRAVEELEKPNAKAVSPVRATSLEDAVAPRGAVSPRPGVEVPLGLILGFAAGVFVALVVEALRVGGREAAASEAPVGEGQ